LMAEAKVLAGARPPSSLSKVDPAAVRAYLGRYDSAPLGEVSLSLRGDRLVLDAGQLSSELRPLADGGTKAVYLLYDPPLSLFSEAYGTTVSFTGGANEPRMTIAVPASVTGPEQEFVFNPQR
jgi:hypothetical protein